MTEFGRTEPRAGFWRRFGAFVFDFLLLAIPFQLIVAALFSLSGGMIQSSSGVLTNVCVALKEMPPGLVTQIENPNAVNDCRKTFFGLDTARLLIVSRSEKVSEAYTTTVSEGFWLDSNGQLTDRSGINIDLAFIALLVAYLVLMDSRRGATIGGKLLKTLVRDNTSDDSARLSLGRALLRRAAPMFGFIPVVLAALGFRLFAGPSPDDLQKVMMSPLYQAGMYGCVLVGFGWLIWIVVAMARKRDPIHDRLAKAAVVRVP